MKQIYGIIYLITNTINQNQYVGQTKQGIKKRWKAHCYSASIKRNYKSHFHSSIQKYGKESFKIEIIDNALNSTDLSIKEIFWIEQYNTYNKGYNLTTGGEGTNGFSSHNKGKSHYTNDEGKLIYIDELNDDIPDGYTKGGRTHTTKTKERMSETRQNIIFTEEHKQNISKSNKGREVWNKGKTLTAEQKKNMKGSHSRVLSQEEKDILSEHAKNKKHIFNPLTGERKMIHKNSLLPDGFIWGRWFKHSEETKLKMNKHQKKNIGRKWFHNKKLNKNIWVFPDNKPDGYQSGKLPILDENSISIDDLF